VAILSSFMLNCKMLDVKELIDLRSRGRIKEAISLLSQELELHPDQVELWKLLGCAHGFANERHLAVACWTKAIELDAEPGSYFSRARSRIMTGDFEGVLQDCDSILKSHHPTASYLTISVHQIKADILTRLKRYSDALAELGHIPETPFWTDRLLTKAEILMEIENAKP
jgi:tetratricopeptide (TPR) repeat protein